MLSRKDVAVLFAAQFLESKVGKTGLTVTVDIWRVTTAGSATQIVTSGSATAVGKGVYVYSLAGGTNTASGVLIAVFSTATTSVDQREIPAAWSIEIAPAVAVSAMDAGVITATQAPNLDAAISNVPASVVSRTIGIQASGTVGSALLMIDGNLTSTVNAAGWTSTEKSQTRYRLGLDGASATPSASPNLSTLTAAGVWANGTRSLTDKDGFRLASDGLDALSADVPDGVASTFRGRLMQLWGRFFRKHDRNATHIRTYRVDGTTVNTSQTWTNVSGTETVGAAT